MTKKKEQTFEEQGNKLLENYLISAIVKGPKENNVYCHIKQAMILKIILQGIGCFTKMSKYFP